MAADLIVQVKAMLDQYKGEIDEAAAQTEEFAERGSGAMSLLTDNIGAITGVTAGAAAAIEGLARSQQDTRKSILDLGDATELTAEEITEMASSMSNATISADEVVGLFVKAREQGLKTRDELEQFAEFWDMVGDASGENAEQLAGAGRALRAVGIAAGEEEEALGALGFVLQETTGSVEGFLNFTERVGRELGDNTPHVDDMAAALGALEDKGFGSQVAQRELQKALRETDGDFEAAIDTLGITAEQFDELRAQVDASGDVMAQRAENFAETRTKLQEIGAAVGGQLLEWGGLVSTVANFAPALLAVGPAIKGVQLAMTIALGPVGLITAAIAGAAAIAYVLWQNWDEVTALVQGVWESLQIRAGEIFRAVERTINTFVSSVIGFFTDLKHDVVQLIVDMKNAVVEQFTGMFTGAVDTVKDMASGVTGWLGDLKDKVVGNSIIPDMVTDVLAEFDLMRTGSVQTTRDMGRDVETSLQSMANDVRVIGEDLGIGWLQSIGDTVTGTIDKIFGMVQTGKTLLANLADVGTAIGRVWQGEWSSIIKIFSDDTVGQIGTMAGNVIGILNRLMSSASGIAQSVMGMVGSIGSALGSIGSSIGGALSSLGGAGGVAASLGTAAAVVAAPIVGGKIIRSLLGGGNNVQMTDQEFRDFRAGQPGRHGNTDAGSIPGLADGGIVTSPTLAMIGEGGQTEVVQPLDRLREFIGEMRGAGMTVNLTQHITGMTPDDVERQTERALRRVADEWAIAS